MAAVKTWRSPVLLIHGDDDRNVNFNETITLANALRQQGVPIEQLIFPDEYRCAMLGWVQDYLLDPSRLERVGDQFLWRIIP